MGAAHIDQEDCTSVAPFCMILHSQDTLLVALLTIGENSTRSSYAGFASSRGFSLLSSVDKVFDCISCLIIYSRRVHPDTLSDISSCFSDPLALRLLFPPFFAHHPPPRACRHQLLGFLAFRFLGFIFAFLRFSSLSSTVRSVIYESLFKITKKINPEGSEECLWTGLSLPGLRK